jgi:hypothetical protein
VLYLNDLESMNSFAFKSNSALTNVEDQDTALNSGLIQVHFCLFPVFVMKETQ